jgi:hypothetical protein
MDILKKLKAFWPYLQMAFESWKSDIWDKDLDELYCCNGKECCCGGLSVRETHNIG